MCRPQRPGGRWQVAGPCRPSLELNMEQGLACAAERREALPAQHFQEFRTEVFLLLFFFGGLWATKGSSQEPDPQQGLRTSLPGAGVGSPLSTPSSCTNSLPSPARPHHSPLSYLEESTAQLSLALADQPQSGCASSSWLCLESQNRLRQHGPHRCSCGI